MSLPRLGILLEDDSTLAHGRVDDEVAFVVVRSCLLNQPRAAAARALAARVRAVHRAAELVPCAWHYLTHEREDGMAERGTRRLEGDPAGFGHLKDSPEVARAWSAVSAGADAMGAERILLMTPPSFSTGVLARRRLGAFVAAHPDRRFLWQPSGLWSTGEALRLATPLGVEVVDAPLERTGRPDPDAWGAWLLIAGGRDSRLRDAQAEILADAVAERCELTPSEPPRLAFAGPRAYANLRSFAKEWGRLNGAD